MTRTEVTFEGYVHRSGAELHDGLGRPISMRGVGLGNWLLPEGYMWRFPQGVAQSPRAIEALIEDLVGPEEGANFWRTFRERFIAEDDIAEIVKLGFDHVRLPLLGRLLIDHEARLLEDGFALVDRLIEWCRRHGLWVVLDLHGAPGGQTGTNIDDSPRGLPDLFLVGGRYRELTVALWRAIAARYRDEPVVAAYDLLNEPLPHQYGDEYAPELRDLYAELTGVVRAIDAHHLITYEGTHWSTNWSIFEELPDPNAMLQFHKYWSPPDLASIAPYLEARDRLRVPIYMGEGGENTPSWLQAAFGMYDDNSISWNLWPWKKLETLSSPVSVRAPAGWEAVVAYAAGKGPRPDVRTAGRILRELLANVLLGECDPRPDVVHAVFRRVPLTLAPEAHVQDRGAPPLERQPASGGYDYVDGVTPQEAARSVVVPTGTTIRFVVEIDRPGVLHVTGGDALLSMHVDARHLQVTRGEGGLRVTAPVESPTAVLSFTADGSDLLLGPIEVCLAPHAEPGP